MCESELDDGAKYPVCKSWILQRFAESWTLAPYGGDDDAGTSSEAEIELIVLHKTYHGRNAGRSILVFENDWDPHERRIVKSMADSSLCPSIALLYFVLW